MDSYCDRCLFEEVRFSGMIPDIYFYAEIRSRRSKKHVCHFLPRVKIAQLVEKSGFISILDDVLVFYSDLPRISFPKFNYVMKRRFYEISYPVIRRKLWLSSKRTSYLGEKPKMYPARDIELGSNPELYSDLKVDISSTENIVIEAKYFAHLRDMIPDDLIYLSRYVEFNNQTLTVENSELSLEDMKCISNPNVLCVTFRNTNFDFSILMKFLCKLPNMDCLRYDDILEDGWEYDLTGLESKLEVLYVSPKKITNFEVLANLCRNGTHIRMLNCCPTFDVNKLEKFFMEKQKGKLVYNVLDIDDLDFELIVKNC